MAIKLGALWNKQTKTGAVFMSGTIQINGVEKRIVCFKNSYKKPGEDNKPDWIVQESEPQKFNNPRNVVNPKAKMPIDDDTEIPF
jgi:hypothetical protein